MATNIENFLLIIETFGPVCSDFVTHLADIW